MTVRDIDGDCEFALVEGVVAILIDSDGSACRATGQDDHIRCVNLESAEIEAPALKSEEEWRIHYHVPLHAAPTREFDTTADHLIEALNWLQMHPDACSHLEMETYTWEVMPGALKNRSVVDQLVDEYRWTLEALAERGITDG